MAEPKVFLIHGFEGTPNGGWRPWLMAKLGLLDIFACSLAMPTPATPQKEEWLSEIKHAVGTPNDKTILVGHSLGVSAILQYLQTLPEGQTIGGAVLVSGPFRNGTGAEAPLEESFFHPEWNFTKIKNACKH